MTHKICTTCQTAEAADYMDFCDACDFAAFEEGNIEDSPLYDILFEEEMDDTFSQVLYDLSQDSYGPYR